MVRISLLGANCAGAPFWATAREGPVPESLEDRGRPLEDPWKTPDGGRFRQGFVKGHPGLIQGSSRAQNCGKTRMLGIPKNAEIDATIG